VSDSEERTKQLKQRSGCSRRKDEEGAATRTEMGEGSDGLSLLGGALLFILFSICIVLQVGACFGREA